MNPVASALRRIDFADRTVRAVGASAALAFLVLLVALGIGGEDYGRVALVLALVALPFAIVLALRRPMIFPYCVYVLAIPFDNMLSLGAAGTLTKFLALAAAAAIGVHIVRSRRLRKPGPAFWLWCAFWTWAVLGLTWTTDVAAGQQFVTSFGQIILLYGLLAVAPLEERDLRAVLFCIAAGGALAALYGLVLFHDDIGASAAQTGGRLMVNVDTRMIDINHFANALLAPVAIALVTLLHARKPVVALFSIAALAIFGTAIVLTLSREAMLACVIMVAVLVMFTRRRLLAAAIVVPLIALVPFVIPSVGARLASGISEHGGGRNYIWHVVLLAWQEHPWIGWGTGAALTAYNANYLRVYATITEYWSRPPHNTYLHAVVELGVVGLALFLAALFASFSDLRRIPRTHRLYDVRAMLTASLVALIFVATFIDIADYKYFWVVLATIAQFRTVVVPSNAPAP